MNEWSNERSPIPANVVESQIQHLYEENATLKARIKELEETVREKSRLLDLCVLKDKEI